MQQPSGSAEALPLLLTLSSGVTGFTTLHAGSARQALTRLRFVAQLADAAAALPMHALNALISEAVDVVVHVERTSEGPRVSEIVAVEDLVAGADATSFTVTELFTRPTPTAPLCWSGLLPVRAGRALERAGHDVRTLLAAAPRRPERPAGGGR